MRRGKDTRMSGWGVFTPKCQYQGWHTQYWQGAGVSSEEGTHDKWGGVFEVLEVVWGWEHEIGCGRRFYPPMPILSVMHLISAGGQCEQWRGYLWKVGWSIWGGWGGVRVRVLPPNANTERVMLNISGGLVWVAERIPITSGVEYLRWVVEVVWGQECEMWEEVFTPKCQYWAQHTPYQQGAGVSSRECTYDNWSGVFEVLEVVWGWKCKNRCRRKFSPPNANTKCNTLDISGAGVMRVRSGKNYFARSHKVFSVLTR